MIARLTAGPETRAARIWLSPAAPAAWISAAYISLSTACSPKACGMVLVRRRFLTEQPLKQVGRTNRTPVREREARVRNACFEVIL